MYTKIKDVANNKELTFVTQQYEIGTYCIINNDPSQQFGLDVKEEIFHKDLRIDVIKNGDQILKGSFLNVKTKYPINIFAE